MAIVAEWDYGTHDTPPDTSHRQRWAAAVRQAAAGLDAPHLDRDRLTKAMDLCIAGKVTSTGHNAYTVQSGSGHVYQLAPLCDCQDAHRRSKYCKHYLAAQLYAQAHATLYGESRASRPAPAPAAGHGAVDPGGWSALEQAPITPAATPPEDPPAAPAPAAQLPEAPASICMRWDDGPVSMQLTLRDVDDAALFARVKAVLPKIKATAEAQQQAARAHAEATGAPFCPEHGTRKLKPSKYSGVYCTGRKTDGSYCDYAVKDD